MLVYGKAVRRNYMIIWLTGGSGAGKSTAAAIFEKAGYKRVDADAIAREIVMPGEKAYSEILEAFGLDFLLSSGHIDRKALGKAVFSDPEKLEILNRITHREIIAQMVARGAGEKNVVYDAPLPNTFGVPCDKTLYVTAPIETRIARIVLRDNISEDMARDRILAQKSEEDYKKSADAVIENDGDENALKMTAQQFAKEWFSA